LVLHRKPISRVFRPTSSNKSVAGTAYGVNSYGNTPTGVHNEEYRHSVTCRHASSAVWFGSSAHGAARREAASGAPHRPKNRVCIWNRRRWDLARGAAPPCNTRWRGLWPSVRRSRRLGRNWPAKESVWTRRPSAALPNRWERRCWRCGSVNCRLGRSVRRLAGSGGLGGGGGFGDCRKPPGRGLQNAGWEGVRMGIK
jgi:hypothetical protein